MKVELAGPGDLGHWFLVDRDGNAYPLVERHEDHPKAAALFGWTAPEGVADEDEIIDNAIDFLTENIGEEIEAPKEAVEYFRELNDEDDE